MKTVLEGLNTIARLGVAAGLLLIGYEMHAANGPAPSPTATAAGYMQTADTTSAAQKKPPATLNTIDADLREINYTLSGITVAIGQASLSSHR